MSRFRAEIDTRPRSPARGGVVLGHGLAAEQTRDAPPTGRAADVWKAARGAPRCSPRRAARAPGARQGVGGDGREGAARGARRGSPQLPFSRQRRRIDEHQHRGARERERVKDARSARARARERRPGRGRRGHLHARRGGRVRRQPARIGRRRGRPVRDRPVRANACLCGIGGAWAARRRARSRGGRARARAPRRPRVAANAAFGASPTRPVVVFEVLRRTAARRSSRSCRLRARRRLRPEGPCRCARAPRRRREARGEPRRTSA